jgi:hypothetical protein
MAPGYIIPPQLSGCDRRGGARQDRCFLLDRNASLEPNDREQLGLLSAENTGSPIIIAAPIKHTPEAAFTINFVGRPQREGSLAGLSATPNRWRRRLPFAGCGPCRVWPPSNDTIVAAVLSASSLVLPVKLEVLSLALFGRPTVPESALPNLTFRRPVGTAQIFLPTVRISSRSRRFGKRAT